MRTSRLVAMLSLMMLAAVMSFLVSVEPAAAQGSPALFHSAAQAVNLVVVRALV
ncbi:MAG: hypothetical protein H7X75_07175 [Burkholderiaceae bacterium]|nr:hypothetical protein [Burkholderiaceae bacterium]